MINSKTKVYFIKAQKLSAKLKLGTSCYKCYYQNVIVVYTEMTRWCVLHLDFGNNI